MRKTILMMFVLAITACAEDASVPHRHLPDDIFGVLKPEKSAPVVWLMASAADATTDWKFTGPISGRQYTISPKQQVSLAAGVVGVGLVVRHVWPKSAKTVNYIFTVMSAVRAYRAYEHTRQR